MAFAFSTGSAKAVGTLQTDTAQYLRIHIRAHSNGESDQAVKYLVRDAVVEYLTPCVASYASVEQARADVQARSSALDDVAESVLRENGFFYGARVRIVEEAFPTRVYGEFVLPQGVYWAIVIELGSGSGDNWWCVAYPPLCFTSVQNVVYKSKIVEIIQRWKSGKL